MVLFSYNLTLQMLVFLQLIFDLPYTYLNVLNVKDILNKFFFNYIA